MSLEEAVIDPDDPEGTRAAFRAAIREAGRREDYQRIQAVCGAQNAMEKAFFAKAGAGGAAGESPSTPSGSPSPFAKRRTGRILAYFPMQKLEKTSPRISSTPMAPVTRARASAARRRSSPASSGAISSAWRPERAAARASVRRRR